MSGNSFGICFKITTCGESHGGAIAVIIDGCPPNIELTEQSIQKQLDRRKPGQSDLTTTREESDLIHILSGVFEGKTTGTPILMLAHNKDARSEDYEKLKNIYRPSHADYTYQKKYGIRDNRGSGRASARETLARVAAGALAQLILKQKLNIEIISYVEQVSHIKATIDHTSVTQEQVESNSIRCPDSKAANQMIDYIKQTQHQGDTLGGIIKCVIRNVPAGLGEPVFDKLHADLAKAMLSINAARGFEIGSGFDSVLHQGSTHNDGMCLNNDKPHFISNHAGGIVGGISTGEDIYCRVAFKPVSTIQKQQKTLTIDNQEVEFTPQGRHDPCVLPRAVPIVDAMAALVILDHYLRSKAIQI